MASMTPRRWEVTSLSVVGGHEGETLRSPTPCLVQDTLQLASWMDLGKVSSMLTSSLSARPPGGGMELMDRVRGAGISRGAGLSPPGGAVS